MILTKASEINAIMPTARWRKPENLIALTEVEEENTLIPILGEELFDYLVDEYKKIVKEDDSGVTPLENESPTPTVKVIRICQRIILHMALANNSGILGISFNEGGGMNQSSAEYYDVASKEAVSRFERDTWKQAHRAIDSLLVLLEKDACSQTPVFKGKWEKSKYFYYHAGLLFTTAVQMQDFLNISGSREKYIELVPDIKYCQEVYLAPAIGENMFRALVKHTASSANDREAKPYHSEAADRLRIALALYVEARQPKMRRTESLREADMALARATQYIADNQQAFMPEIETSPLYTPPKNAQAQMTGTESQAKGCQCKFNPHDPNNAAMAFPFVRRF